MMADFRDRENKRKNSVVSSMISGELKQECKSKEHREIKQRISFTILPSIYNGIKKIAYVDRKSISEIISDCLSKYLEDNRNKLNEYEKLFKQK